MDELMNASDLKGWLTNSQIIVVLGQTLFQHEKKVLATAAHLKKQEQFESQVINFIGFNKFNYFDNIIIKKKTITTTNNF